MNIVLEIIIFNVVVFTICGINMAKKRTTRCMDTRVSKSNTGSMQRAWTDRGKLWQVDEKGNDR